MDTFLARVQTEAEAAPHFGSQAGLSILEIAMSMVLLSILFLGLFSGISKALVAQRDSAVEVDQRRLLNRVCEELKVVDFDDLLALQGQRVIDGNYHVDISMVLLSEHLIQAQVDVGSDVVSGVDGQALLLFADTDS